MISMRLHDQEPTTIMVLVVGGTGLVARPKPTHRTNKDNLGLRSSTVLVVFTISYLSIHVDSSMRPQSEDYSLLQNGLGSVKNP